jgi:hypothetical protein
MGFHQRLHQLDQLGKGKGLHEEALGVDFLGAAAVLFMSTDHQNGSGAPLAPLDFPHQRYAVQTRQAQVENNNLITTERKSVNTSSGSVQTKG